MRTGATGMIEGRVRNSVGIEAMTIMSVAIGTNAAGIVVDIPWSSSSMCITSSVTRIGCGYITNTNVAFAMHIGIIGQISGQVMLSCLLTVRTSCPYLYMC